MTEKLELYKCNICKNLVEVVFAGQGELVCCGQPMEKQEEQSRDEVALSEKHVPFITKIDGGFEIKIGTNLHPMIDEHYIMFIEVHSPDKKYVKRKYFAPNEAPILNLKCSCDKVIARELCNIHGLWINESE